MEMMLDKKQIWGTFLSEFKRGHKAAETAHNINNTFGPWTANEKYSAAVVQEVLQRRWEPWSWEAQWLAVGSWQLATESIIEADPLTTIGEGAEELNDDHAMVVWHLKQIGKVEKAQ